MFVVSLVQYKIIMGIGNILKGILHNITNPQNYLKSSTYTATIILIGVLLCFFRHKVYSLLQNKNFWATLALCVCFYGASGQTWNQIRKPQKYMEKKDDVTYFNGAYKSQFLWESYIVAGTYAGVVLGFILLIEAEGGVNKENLKERTRWQCVQSSIGLIIVCISISMLLDFLRKKRWHVSGIFLLEM